MILLHELRICCNYTRFTSPPYSPWLERFYVNLL